VRRQLHNSFYRHIFSKRETNSLLSFPVVFVSLHPGDMAPQHLLPRHEGFGHGHEGSDTALTDSPHGEGLGSLGCFISVASTDHRHWPDDRQLQSWLTLCPLFLCAPDCPVEVCVSKGIRRHPVWLRVSCLSGAGVGRWLRKCTRPAMTGDFS